MATVVLVLSSPLLMAGLRRLLTEAGYSILSEEADPSRAVASNTSGAGFAIVDAKFCAADPAVVRRLRETVADRVVVIGHRDDLLRLEPDQIVAADGILSFEATSAALLQTLPLVAAGERVIPRELMQAMVTHGAATPTPSNRPGLSPREAEMLRHLVLGTSNKEIARKLGITEATVKVHLKGVYRKLRVENRTQAALWGREQGFGG